MNLFLICFESVASLIKLFKGWKPLLSITVRDKLAVAARSLSRSLERVAFIAEPVFSLSRWYSLRC